MFKRRYFLALFLVAALVVPMVLQATPVLACSMGLTPGYWKNHTFWVGGYVDKQSSIQKYYDQIFQLPFNHVTGSDGSNVSLHITLMQALNANGNKNGVNAFLRQSAAALLNAVYLEDYGSPIDIKAIVQAAFGTVSDADWNDYLMQRGIAEGDIDGWKNYLEAWNTMENAVFRDNNNLNPIPWYRYYNLTRK